RAALRARRDAALDAGLVGGRALLDALDERATGGRQVQTGERAVDRDRGHAEIAGTRDRAALLEFAQLGLRGVDRHGETDADAAVARPARLDLGVDADHATLRVDQRTARVARVDRGIGLDDVVDREAVRGFQLALERRDDTG